jgi:hypothetical protein
MSEYAQLIEQLHSRLEEFEYTAEDEISFLDAVYISYVKNASILKVRNLCALLEMPGAIKNTASAKVFFEDFRRCLLAKYGQAFLWKELEMCFVVVCEHDMYQLLKEDEGEVAAEAGFYLSSMMGTCFIDKTTFDYFYHSTWGLYFSGDHYKAVREVVADWCENQRSGIKVTDAC